MTNKNTGLRRLLAGTGAFALALAGTFATAQLASADVGPDQPTAPATGSIIIHKREGAQGTAGDGTVLTPAPGEPLGGVTFTRWQLGFLDDTTNPSTCTTIDLAKTDHWAHVPTGVAPATLDGLAGAGLCVVAPTAGTAFPATNATTGVTSDSGLLKGLFYIQETAAPANVVGRAAPFFVAVPTPNGNDWIYDVNVYPKNTTLDAPTKTINPDGAQPGKGLSVGSNVEWTIEQKIPATNTGDGEKLKYAEIYDLLDSRLEYVSSTLSVVPVAADADPIPLTPDTHYTLDDEGVTWVFTAAGLDVLNNNPGGTIKVIFETKVLEIGADGNIVNPGGVDNGYGSRFSTKPYDPENPPPGTPGDPEPQTYWGALQLKKVDEDAKPLAGAEFKVFAKGTGECFETAPDTGAVSTGISLPDGSVIWTPGGLVRVITPADDDSPAVTAPVLGLWIANSPDGPLTSPNKDYCLYETKVPAGYTGAAVQTVNIKPGLDATLMLDVENVQKDGPDLPLTGAAGTVAMTFGGLLLVGAGVAVALVSRRRNNAAA
jgi:fimbrial isopeptide formation D2 family protein/LPXTG-motif cell wall-anchored protein